MVRRGRDNLCELHQQPLGRLLFRCEVEGVDFQISWWEHRHHQMCCFFSKNYIRHFCKLQLIRPFWTVKNGGISQVVAGGTQWGSAASAGWLWACSGTNPVGSSPVPCKQLVAVAVSYIASSFMIVSESKANSSRGFLQNWPLDSGVCILTAVRLRQKTMPGRSCGSKARESYRITRKKDWDSCVGSRCRDTDRL